MTWLFSHPTLKACNSPYMQYYFKRFFVLHSSEGIFLFLIKKSKQKAIEIKIASFHPLGNPKGRTWIISFILHISAIISPTNYYLYQWVSWNISEVINKNSLSAFNYLDDFSFHRSSILEPKTNYQPFNMIIGFGYKDARAPTRWSCYARLATYLNLNMLWSNPRNKIVEKWSGQLRRLRSDLLNPKFGSQKSALLWLKSHNFSET